jgi:hypothetical protein
MPQPPTSDVGGCGRIQAVTTRGGTARAAAPRARAVSGRARVVREVRAAGALAERLRAPVTARGPWLTAVLNTLAARRSLVRPVAVVVDDPAGEAPAAAAFLTVRPGVRTVVRLLTAAAGPLPGGRPPARLLARDDAAAEALADGIVALLAARRRPWRIELTGLPLGDPTLRALAARLPAATLANERSVRLVDELAGADRTTDPREVDRLLPSLLPGNVPRREAAFLRAAVRLHAALGAVEVAVVPAGGGLVTLLDGGDRWPWWGSAASGLRTEMGAPLVRLTAAGWRVSPRGGSR